MIKFDRTGYLFAASGTGMHKMDMSGNRGQAPLILAWDPSAIPPLQGIITDDWDYINLQSACTKGDIDRILAHMKILRWFLNWVNFAQACVSVWQKFAQLLLCPSLSTIIHAKINIKRILPCTRKVSVFGN